MFIVANGCVARRGIARAVGHMRRVPISGAATSDDQEHQLATSVGVLRIMSLSGVRRRAFSISGASSGAHQAGHRGIARSKSRALWRPPLVSSVNVVAIALASPVGRCRAALGVCRNVRTRSGTWVRSGSFDGLYNTRLHQTALREPFSNSGRGEPV